MTSHFDVLNVTLTSQFDVLNVTLTFQFDVLNVTLTFQFDVLNVTLISHFDVLNVTLTVHFNVFNVTFSFYFDVKMVTLTVPLDVFNVTFSFCFDVLNVTLTFDVNVLNLTLTVSYFTFFFSPLTGKMTIVNDQGLADAGSYGVKSAEYDQGFVKIKNGSKTRYEFGAYLNAKFQKDIMKNVNLLTKIDLFSNYANNPQNIDVNWEVLIAMSVN